jgi:hypothetical protein
MKKTLNIVGIVVGVVLVCLIGRCFYMVACISCTSPPIKVYNYNGSVAQLSKSFQKFVISHPTIRVKISRRNYAVEDDGSRDVSIVFTKDTTTTTYDMVCDQDQKEQNVYETHIKLTSAFNNKPFFGGYGIKADGMKQLISKFNNEFLETLSKEQHVFVKEE